MSMYCGMDIRFHCSKARFLEIQKEIQEKYTDEYGLFVVPDLIYEEEKPADEVWLGKIVKNSYPVLELHQRICGKAYNLTLRAFQSLCELLDCDISMSASFEAERYENTYEYEFLNHKLWRARTIKHNWLITEPDGTIVEERFPGLAEGEEVITPWEYENAPEKEVKE